MTFAPRFNDGYYDESGSWRRTKFCFVYCGDSCTCGPPFEIYQLTGDALERHKERMSRLKLSDRDRDQVLDALRNPPEPTEILKNTLAKHKDEK
jgi:hypothetical protein